MTDPATLRVQAEQLRRTARSIRANAAALDDGLGTLQSRCPLRSGGVWAGPYADRHAEGVSDAKGDLAALSRSVTERSTMSTRSNHTSCDSSAPNRTRSPSPCISAKWPARPALTVTRPVSTPLACSVQRNHGCDHM
ncbi:MAG: hypothetical protein ACRDO0_16120 [Nocardioidaceae bacterium]